MITKTKGKAWTVEEDNILLKQVKVALENDEPLELAMNRASNALNSRSVKSCWGRWKRTLENTFNLDNSQQVEQVTIEEVESEELLHKKYIGEALNVINNYVRNSDLDIKTMKIEIEELKHELHKANIESNIHKERARVLEIENQKLKSELKNSNTANEILRNDLQKVKSEHDVFIQAFNIAQYNVANKQEPEIKSYRMDANGNIEIIQT